MLYDRIIFARLLLASSPPLEPHHVTILGGLNAESRGKQGLDGLSGLLRYFPASRRREHPALHVRQAFVQVLLQSALMFAVGNERSSEEEASIRKRFQQADILEDMGSGIPFTYCLMSLCC